MVVDSDRNVIEAIKTSLQANLVDPREQFETRDRNWVHDDSPLISATYPRIQVRKRGPSTTRIIDLGWDFMEHKTMILDIQFWTKSPFKWSDGTEYLKDEALVREYLHKIWVAIKDQGSTLYTDEGITGFKNMGEEDAYFEPNTELFTGIVSVRVWWFRT